MKRVAELWRQGGWPPVERLDAARLQRRRALYGHRKQVHVGQGRWRLACAQWQEMPIGPVAWTLQHRERRACSPQARPRSAAEKERGAPLVWPRNTAWPLRT